MFILYRPGSLALSAAAINRLGQGAMGSPVSSVPPAGHSPYATLSLVNLPSQWTTHPRTIYHPDMPPFLPEFTT